MNESNGQIAIYQTADGQTQIDVRFEQDTFWLSQAQMARCLTRTATLFGLHLKNILRIRRAG